MKPFYQNHQSGARQYSSLSIVNNVPTAVWNEVDRLLSALDTAPHYMIFPRKLQREIERIPAVALSVIAGFVAVNPTQEGDICLSLPGTFNAEGVA